MTDLRKMATEFAKEMIEHNLKNGAQTLDKKYIADDACELAYLIDKKIRKYEANGDVGLRASGSSMGIHGTVKAYPDLNPHQP